MKKKIFLTMFFFFVFASNIFSQEFEWLKKMRQVNLLSDTYEDVIKIFGKPSDGTSERALAEYFDIKEGRVFALFATGECVITPYSNGKLSGWKVPAYTVIDLSFSPNKKIKLKEFLKKLKLNLADFRSYEVYDVPKAYIYYNDKLGFDFVVDPKGKVEDVSFRPSEELDYLYCH